MAIQGWTVRRRQREWGTIRVDLEPMVSYRPRPFWHFIPLLAVGALTALAADRIAPASPILVVFVAAVAGMVLALWAFRVLWPYRESFQEALCLGYFGGSGGGVAALVVVWLYAYVESRLDGACLLERMGLALAVPGLPLLAWIIEGGVAELRRLIPGMRPWPHLLLGALVALGLALGMRPPAWVASSSGPLAAYLGAYLLSYLISPGRRPSSLHWAHGWLGALAGAGVTILAQAVQHYQESLSLGQFCAALGMALGTLFGLELSLGLLGYLTSGPPESDQEILDMDQRPGALIDP